MKTLLFITAISFFIISILVRPNALDYKQSVELFNHMEVACNRLMVLSFLLLCSCIIFFRSPSHKNIHLFNN